MVKLTRVLALGSIVVLMLSFIVVYRVQAQNFSAGDQWTYGVTDSFEGITMTGTEVMTYNGTSAVTVNGTYYDVYVIDFNGSISMHDSHDSIWFNTTDQSYYTIDSMDLVMDNYTSLYQEETNSSGSPVIFTIQEHNVTTYFPPEGYGAWPMNPSIGQSWSVAYPCYSNVTLVTDGTPSSYLIYANESITYRYDGITNISVPAGAFECYVLNETGSDWTQTIWESDTVGNDVKAVESTAAGETVTLLLESYSYSGQGTAIPEFGMMPFVVIALMAGILLAGETRRKRES